MEMEVDVGSSAGSGTIIPSTMGSTASAPIDSSNIGFQLLRKHGCKEGTGLGVSEQDRLEPVHAFVQNTKQGLRADKPTEEIKDLKIPNHDDQKEQTSHGTKSSVINLTKDLNLINPVYEPIDFSEEFTTNEIFENRELLVNWVSTVGHRYNMVILVRRSDSGESGRRARVFLGCERGGKYCPPKPKISREKLVERKKKPSQERIIDAKKCECPFLLKGSQFNDKGQWSLTVICGVHNHPMGQLVRYSFAGRLTPDEDRFVLELLKNNTKSKDILSSLKESFPENQSTLKTIYNARQRHRIIEHGGQTQMQSLLEKLHLEKYLYFDRRCEQTNRVRDFFYAHPTSVDLLHAFPGVLLMGCIYNTNRYNMPLLEVVGVTSTDITFPVAYVYMEAEHEDNYRWALTTLKDLMDPSCLPSVIVTNREIALMNAIQVTFPISTHLLCRLHINKNVLANCKKLLVTKDKWDRFNNSWNGLMLAASEASFSDLLQRFKDDYADYPKAVDYVINNWIEPYKERFVSCWTDNVMHFDNTTSSRAESAHLRLKKQLGTSQSNFEISWERIHSLLITSHNTVKASFETSLNVTLPRYKSPVFNIIRGLVSHAALHKIFEEMKGVEAIGVNPLMCGCVLRRTCGLPCAHEIAELTQAGQPISLEMVDKFWLKLDCEPSEINVSFAEDVRIRANDVMGKWKNKFETATEPERLLMLKRLEEITDPSKSSLLEPNVQPCVRGRPSKTTIPQSKYMKCEPSAFEIVEVFNESCSSST